MNSVHSFIHNMYNYNYNYNNAIEPHKKIVWNKWTYELMDSIIASDKFMQHNTLKIFIRKKQMRIVIQPKNTDITHILDMVRDYVHGQSQERGFYIYVITAHNYNYNYKAKYSFLPFFYVSLPNTRDHVYKSGLLIPDYYPEKNVEEEMSIINPTKELFLVGFLNSKNAPITEPHDTSCMYNLSNWKTCKTLEWYNPQNFKKLFMHNILVQEQFPKKSIILLDLLFSPGRDYIALHSNNRTEEENYNILKANGFAKSKLLTRKNILKIFTSIINKYIAFMPINIPVQRNVILGEKIGSGYQGSVYISNESIIVKVMPIIRLSTSAFYEFLFTSIIETSPGADKYFLKFRDGFIKNNNIYLFIERADCNLLQFIKEHGNININIWRKVYTEVKESIEFLHSINIIHCDIQPKNIMYSKKKDKFFVIDFGLAEWAKNQHNVDYEMLADVPNKTKIDRILAQHSVDFLLSECNPEDIIKLKNRIFAKSPQFEINLNTELAKFAAFNYIKKYNIYTNDPENMLFRL